MKCMQRQPWVRTPAPNDDARDDVRPASASLAVALDATSVDLLRAADTGARASAMLRAQREHGNAFVQRTVQRQRRDPLGNLPHDNRGHGDDPGEELRRFAQQQLGRLSAEAQRRLVRAWREAPGGVIAAATVLGAAGVTYLVGTRSRLPSLPGIPLDFLGPVFRGITVNVDAGGTITAPESLQLRLSYSEGRDSYTRSAVSVQQPQAVAGFDAAAIAASVEGPEFETEAPGRGPRSNLSGPNLAELVRTIGDALHAAARRHEARPDIHLNLTDYGPLPNTFGTGLRRIVAAVRPGLPLDTEFRRIRFFVHQGTHVRWIAIVPEEDAEP